MIEVLVEGGLAIDYVETNSSWFRDPESADDLLADLRDAGLGCLLLSISPFHNAAIPLFQVKQVVAACRRAGLRPLLWVADFLDDIEALGDAACHRLSEFEARFGADYLARIPDRYWIHLGGRALSTFAPVARAIPAAEILAQATRGCAELGRTDHFHIDLDGNYVPGLCAGLAIAMDDLGAPLDPGRYPLITALHGDGVRGLYTLAERDHGFVARRRGYLSRCDLCDHIRSHLARASAGFAELAPAGFYPAHTAASG